MASGDFTNTNQRQEILDYLEGNYSHPTAEEVYSAVKKKLPRITKATVYRNLKFLAEKKIINEVNIKGAARYEPALAHHHHVICMVCGGIMDFESKKLSDYAMKVAGEFGGAEIDSAYTNFYGKCSKCLEGDKKWMKKKRMR